MTDNVFCLKCDSQMVKRIVTKGEKAGEVFYDCKQCLYFMHESNLSWKVAKPCECGKRMIAWRNYKHTPGECISFYVCECKKYEIVPAFPEEVPPAGIIRPVREATV